MPRTVTLVPAITLPLVGEVTMTDTPPPVVVVVVVVPPHPVKPSSATTLMMPQTFVIVPPIRAGQDTNFSHAVEC